MQQPLNLAATENSAETLSQEEVRFQKGVFQTFLYMRESVDPTNDIKQNQEALQSYILASVKVDRINQDIKNNSTTNPNCLRFLYLYNDISSQLILNYVDYLKPERLDADTRANIQARLKILQLFETALFVQVIAKSEAGQSELDPDERFTCNVKDRNQWAETLFQAHQFIEVLQEKVFGRLSAFSPIFDTSIISSTNETYITNRIAKISTWIFSETLASIALWEKYVGPKVTQLAEASPYGRAVKIGGSVAYILGWVQTDRVARTHVSFLEPLPREDLADFDTLSSWERLIAGAEQFVDSRLNSPTLYYSYLKLISTMQKQRTLDFLTENAGLLAEAEQKYGSIDNALNQLKEVLNETHNDNHVDVQLKLQAAVGN